MDRGQTAQCLVDARARVSSEGEFLHAYNYVLQSRSILIIP
jgi:hypothetical protein